MFDCLGTNYINFPALPFIFENGEGIIMSNQKKYIVTLTKNTFNIDNKGLFTKLTLPKDLVKKYSLLK